MKNLKEFNLHELNNQEIQKIDGGCLSAEDAAAIEEILDAITETYL